MTIRPNTHRILSQTSCATVQREENGQQKDDQDIIEDRRPQHAKSHTRAELFELHQGARGNADGRRTEGQPQEDGLICMSDRPAYPVAYPSSTGKMTPITPDMAETFPLCRNSFTCSSSPARNINSKTPISPISLQDFRHEFFVEDRQVEQVEQRRSKTESQRPALPEPKAVPAVMAR